MFNDNDMDMFIFRLLITYKNLCMYKREKYSVAPWVHNLEKFKVESFFL